MSLSQLARSIKESPTLKLNETAALLRDKGEPVIHLGGGEPKSKTPIDAILQCTSLLNTGEIRYTPADGIAPLKKAVIRYTEDHYDRLVAPENVIISSGAKQAIMVALHSILDPNDEVVFPVPYWVSYPDMVRLAGGVPVPVDRRATAVSSPRSPTSPRRSDLIPRPSFSIRRTIRAAWCIRPSSSREVVRLCEERKLWLIMDDTYNRLIFDGRQPVNCYDYATDLSEQSKLILINCVSKMYAMTGLPDRLGGGQPRGDPGHGQYPVAADVGSRRRRRSGRRSARSTACSRPSRRCA